MSAADRGQRVAGCFRAAAWRRAGGGVGVGAAVGRGVGVGVGGGVGAGVGVGGGNVTVTVGPTSGSGWGLAEVDAWKVTGKMPTGSVEVPTHVPACVLPLARARVTVVLPNSAQTAVAFLTGFDEL